MYNQYRFSDFNPNNRNSYNAQIEIEKCIFFDGIYQFLQEHNNTVDSFNQMIQQVFENENKEIYVHIFCKNANKIASACSDRIWISISYTNQYHQESEINNKQNIFTLYSGYPHSLNLFSMNHDSIQKLRLILESSSHKKIFATKETANDAIGIFFNYFKIKIKSAIYLSKDNNRWLTELESFKNEKAVKDLVGNTMQCFERNDQDEYGQILNYVTRFQSNEPTETDDQHHIVILLSTFHWIMYFVKENQSM